MAVAAFEANTNPRLRLLPAPRRRPLARGLAFLSGAGKAAAGTPRKRSARARRGRYSFVFFVHSTCAGAEEFNGVGYVTVTGNVLQDRDALVCRVWYC